MKISASDRSTLGTAHDVLEKRVVLPWYRRLPPFLGPAFMAAVAYVDPGNFATNIQAGAKFGYQLVWVIALSNAMAMLIQTLSAKLGIVTGSNLAEVCRDQFPRGVVWFMWIVMEVVAMATDLAEFLGAALGFYLLFHIPLFWAAILTGVVTFLILGLERYGFRPLEAVISVLIGIVALSYLVETLISPPDWAEVAHSMVMPRLGGTESVLLASGILGATVMPHVIFLHSSLMQGRIVVRDIAKQKLILRYEIVDVLIAMGIAGAVNAAMLLMAASTFYTQGLHEVGSIEEAYRTLTPLLGRAASDCFAISLLAAGLSSATVGTMSGQVIMQGFLHFGIPVWVRRLVTMAPSLFVIGWGLDPTRTLVVSQVILSFGLPFAIVPLIMFTSNAGIMKTLVNSRITTTAAWVIAALIISLNIFLIYSLVAGG